MSQSVVNPTATSVVPSTTLVLMSGVGLRSRPAVVSWGPNRLDCFVRGINDVPWHKWFDGNGWHDWESLGGVLTSKPVVVSWGPNRLDCFVRGTDNALWHKWFDTNGWHDWESLGGNLIDTPAVVSWGPNRLDCFIRGADNVPWHKSFDNNGWHDWENLGGAITSAPAVTSWASGRLDCFAKGGDNALWHTWFDASGQHTWNSQWERLGGRFVDAPAVTSWGSNRLDCFAYGIDSMLQHTWFDTNGWHDWESLSEGLAAGTSVLLGTANSPATKDQLWTLTSDGHIQSQANPNLVLNSKDGQLAAGTSIELGTISSPTAKSQLWTFTSDGHIQNQGNSTLVLDTAGSQLTAGTPIQLGALSSSPVTNQLWTLTSDGHIQSKVVPGVITIHHQGGYVATCTIEFDTNGQHQSQSSGNITAGQTYSVPFPLGATNVHVKCEEATGLVWKPWMTVIDKTYPTAPQKSFTLTGTTLSPSFTEEAGSGLTQQTSFTFINDLNRPAYVAAHHLGAAGLPWRNGKPKCWDQTLQSNQSATYAPDQWIVNFITWITLIADGLLCIVTIVAAALSGGAATPAAVAAGELTADTAAEVLAGAVGESVAESVAAESASVVDATEISSEAATEASTTASGTTETASTAGKAVQTVGEKTAESFTDKAIARVASLLGQDPQEFAVTAGRYIKLAQDYGGAVAKVATVGKDIAAAGFAVNAYKALANDGWALYIEVDGHGYYVSNFIVSGGNYYIPISLAIAGLEIQVNNQGGYVARCTIEYDLNGQHQSQSSDNFPVAQNYSLLVPAGAINIHVKCEEETGLVWEPWRTVVDETNPGPARLGTFKTYTLTGTTLNPSFSVAE